MVVVVEAMWCEQQCQMLLFNVVGEEAGKEKRNVGFYKKRKTEFLWVFVKNSRKIVENFS